MDAEVRTLEDIFSSSVQLLVPLFQRPYVWEQGTQWEPLWQDVQAVADHLRDQLASGVSAKKAQAEVTAHFMGAVVLQKTHTAIGEMHRYAVIDGQQRLTTLQLLLDAAQAAVEASGDAEKADLLKLLIVNTAKLKSEDDRLKILPTNTDRTAFREVMDAPAPVDHASLQNSRARVVEAHRFFSCAVAEWIGQGADVVDQRRRAEALTTVLLGLLKVVAIELDVDENAQLIFETLNARNTPLLASDLVKNVLFQRIEELEAGQSEALYEKHWRTLDGEPWRKTVRQGRLVRPRLDLFLYYWLIMHTGKAVTTHEVFTTVRQMLDDGAAPTTVLASISANAARYDAFEHASSASALGTFRYRVIDVMQADVVTPLLLWLHDPLRPVVPADEVDAALRHVESWSVRRMLCRLTTKGYNQLILDLIEDLQRGDRAHAGDGVRKFLIDQTAEARLWPSDAAVKDSLISGELYRTLSRARLRMVLEALEDRLRTEYSEQQVDRSRYTIEHVLPQSWGKHWALSSNDPELPARRNHVLHTLGNLTLVTKKLNPKLSNDPWSTKRTTLAGHSVLRLNHDLLAQAADPWDEGQIAERSARLSDVVLTIWSRP